MAKTPARPKTVPAPSPPPVPKARAGGRPPSRAVVTKIILDDLTSPLTPADAAELFAVAVMDRLKKIAPEVMAKFDRSWFNVFVDLAVAVTAQCPEEAVAETFREIDDEQKKIHARVLRRRLARSLPAEAVNQLDDIGRYWLSVAAIEAVAHAFEDQDLWDALWGRKTGWFPVPMIAREPYEEGPNGPPKE